MPPTVAIWTLLDDQATWLVRFTVAPLAAVPMAMNWLVWPGELTVCESGITLSPVIPVTVPVPPLEPATVRVDDAESTPVNPPMVAVMVVLPEATPVAMPEELMVATLGTLDVQVTWLVMFEVVEG